MVKIAYYRELGSSKLNIEEYLNRLKRSLREQIIKIGEREPNKASAISHKLINCNWTRREIEQLRSMGLEIADLP